MSYCFFSFVIHITHEHKTFKTCICVLPQKQKKILTMSVLTCAKDGTLNIPWISSGGLLTPNHKNMFIPLANRNIPSSERRDSEQRIEAGNAVLLTSNVCCAGKGESVRNSILLSFLSSSLFFSFQHPPPTLPSFQCYLMCAYCARHYSSHYTIIPALNRAIFGTKMRQ